MVLIDEFLKLIIRRAIVRNSSLPGTVDYLKADLEEKGFAHVDKIPDEVGLIIVQEALRRAAEMEKDGHPRYGQFNKQIELAADSIIAAFRGSPDADPRIKNILSFNRVI